MDITIQPKKLSGSITAIPSKSQAHRLLICAGMSQGQSVIRGISQSEDILATLDCLQALGVRYQREGDTVTVEGIVMSLKELQERNVHPLISVKPSGRLIVFRLRH